MLSQFSFAARTVQEMQSWFIDIMNHLSAKNYKNGPWTPAITGMTGTPAVEAWYQRFGIECSFTILINGTHTMNDGTEMTLPVVPVGSGIVMIHSLTTNSFITTANINLSTLRINVPNYFVTDEVVITRGFYRVSGI